MDGSTMDRNGEDVGQIIPLALSAGTVKVLFLPRRPPAWLGTAECGAGT